MVEGECVASQEHKGAPLVSDGVSDPSTSQLAMEINRTFDALMMDMLLLRAQKLSDQTPETLATLVCPKTGHRSVSGMSVYTNT